MLVIIQARSNSKRFHNKVLADIYGRPLIYHVVKRVQKTKNKIKLLVGSSKNKSDDKLISYLKKEKIDFYRGDLHNVADRMCKIAEKNKSKYFLRISGDSPLIKSRIIDKAINIFRRNSIYDVITNVFPRSYPKGQSVEIIKTSILKKNLKFMNKTEKEHVTKYFYLNSDKFKILNFWNKGKNSIDQAVDTKQDLKRLKKKYKSIFIKNLK